MTAPERTPRDALAEGLVDAAGFVGGALAGWQLGRWLGFDVRAPGDWSLHTLAGWALLLLGCGLGKRASLQQRDRRLNTKD